MAGIAD